MLFRDLQMERWSVERAADWQSLGSGSAVVGKKIGHRSRLSGRAADRNGEVEAPNFNISNKSGINHGKALMASIFFVPLHQKSRGKRAWRQRWIP